MACDREDPSSLLVTLLRCVARHSLWAQPMKATRQSRLLAPVPGQRRRSDTPPHALLATLCLIAVTCGATQEPFAREADDAASALSAAAATLDFTHAGKLTATYARASFVIYRDQLVGREERLLRREGAPDRAALERLLVLYREALFAVQEPCLDESCDWRSQLSVMTSASEALREAGRSR